LSNVKKKWTIITQSVSLDILAFVCFISLIDSGLVLFNKPNIYFFDLCQLSILSKTLIIVIDIVSFIAIDPFGLHFIFKNKKRE